MARICVKAFYQIHPGVDLRQGKKSERELQRQKALLGMLPFW